MKNPAPFILAVLIGMAGTSCTLQRFSLNSDQFEAKLAGNWQVGGNMTVFESKLPVKLHLKNGDLIVLEGGGYVITQLGKVSFLNNKDGTVRYYDIHRKEQGMWQSEVPLSEIAYVQYGKKTEDAIWWLASILPMAALGAFIYVIFTIGD